MRVVGTFFAMVVVGFAAIQAAAQIQVTLQGNQGPWNQTLNQNYTYGDNDNADPVVISAATGFSFVPGGTVTVSYVSGTVTAGAGSPYVDANGWLAFPTNNTVGLAGNWPSYYMSPYPIYEVELVGTFANNGVIIGQPFAIGDGPATFVIPAGANQLLLGANDNAYSDNLGSWTLSVSTGSGSKPTISLVSPILVLANLDPVIVIEGSGFGSPTDCVPSYSNPCVNDRSYFKLSDVTQKWNAGYVVPGKLIGDTCNVSIYEWNNSEIVLQVHLSPLGFVSCPLQIGDTLKVQVWNPANTSDPSKPWTLTGTGQMGIFVSLTGGTINVGPYAVFSHNDIATLTNGVVAALNAQGIGISAADVNFTEVDTSFINVPGVAEVDDFIALPNDFIDLFSSDVTLIDTGAVAGLGGAAELLTLNLAQECSLAPSCLASPPELVATLATDILSLDETYVEQEDIYDYCSQPDYIIGPTQALEITIEGLTIPPSQLATINLPVAWSYAQGLSSPTCTAVIGGGSGGVLVAQAQPSGSVAITSPTVPRQRKWDSLRPGIKLHI